MHIPATSPTIKKHLEAFVASGDLTELPGPADTRYQIDPSPILDEFYRLTVPTYPASQGFKYLAHAEPAAHILETHRCRTHPDTDDPTIILQKYVRNLYRGRISQDFFDQVIAGKKRPEDLPQTVIRAPFRGGRDTRLKRTREAIHVSLVEYTIIPENLYHFLRTPDGKRWLIYALKP